MSEELPRGWTTAPLGEIVEINPRHQKDVDDSTTVSFATMAAISESSPYFQFLDERPLGKVRSGFTHFANGDVLFAKITPCMENGKGAVAANLRNGLGCGTTELHVLRPPKGIDSYYLYRFLAQPSVRREAKENFTGTAGQARVPTDFIKELEIPVPPAAEQSRIIFKLEKCLSKVSKTQDRLDRIPTILKRFRQSVLAAACSGRLTADWSIKKRGVINGGQGWMVVKTIEACESVQSGSTPSKEFFQDNPGIPFLKIFNIVNQQIDFTTKTQFINTEIHKKSGKRSTVKPGDVLMNIVGPPLGKVAIAPNTYPEWNINQAIVLFRPNQTLLTQFLYYLLCSGIPYANILNETRGSAGQVNISLSQCREMKIPVPELDEQEEIIRRVDMLFALGDKIEARYIKANSNVTKLTQSILAKAFRGELVPQDSNDEPASVLLERIRNPANGKKGNKGN